jgi:hypothetical protein
MKNEKNDRPEVVAENEAIPLLLDDRVQLHAISLEHAMLSHAKAASTTRSRQHRGEIDRHARKRNRVRWKAAKRETGATHDEIDRSRGLSVGHEPQQIADDQRSERLEDACHVLADLEMHACGREVRDRTSNFVGRPYAHLEVHGTHPSLMFEGIPQGTSNRGGERYTDDVE